MNLLAAVPSNCIRAISTTLARDGCRHSTNHYPYLDKSLPKRPELQRKGCCKPSSKSHEPCAPDGIALVQRTKVLSQIRVQYGMHQLHLQSEISISNIYRIIKPVEFTPDQNKNKQMQRGRYATNR